MGGSNGATGKAGNGKRDGSGNGNGKRERKREQEIKRVDHISHIEREVCAYVRAQMQWISAVRLLYESSYGLEASCFGRETSLYSLMKILDCARVHVFCGHIKLRYSM